MSVSHPKPSQAVDTRRLGWHIHRHRDDRHVWVPLLIFATETISRKQKNELHLGYNMHIVPFYVRLVAIYLFQFNLYACMEGRERERESTALSRVIPEMESGFLMDDSRPSPFSSCVRWRLRFPPNARLFVPYVCGTSTRRTLLLQPFK